MKRRSFLALLGLAPVAPITAKAAIDPEELRPTEVTDMVRRKMGSGFHSIEYTTLNNGQTLMYTQIGENIYAYTGEPITVHNGDTITMDLPYIMRG